MAAEHIVRSFDEELRELDKAIAAMGGMAEAQLVAAINVMMKRDTEGAAKVVAGDAPIDAMEDEINHRAMRLLALRQPMALDLRIVLAALKIAGELERIGDYAKNIAKRTSTLAQSPEISATRTIGRMGDIVQGMIADVLDAFAHRDPDKAEDVRLRDEEVDALHTSLFRELLTYMMEDPRNITPCTHLLFVAKNVERIGDHATNIAENIAFMVKGETPTDERPKDDRASTTVVKPDA
ncbi:MAG: phosphate signaling complex protein PhoU [Rhodospirillales bacterium]|nr:phosphate signaling complex protein PhoU [Rhodospirillales bacterium]MCW8951261.1 phosphate signaling complex protein PhoU [Rhodospirillales bacterium]MCW9001827.1 phosphate signaling complex protein PhoU [Rhodospirillales bacterium]MCW9039429.1 phosphate signaling complex protein PhoU [Rhodospirillales bacterium]